MKARMHKKVSLYQSNDILIRICVVKCRACRIYEMYNLARKIISVQERIKRLTLSSIYQAALNSQITSSSDCENRFCRTYELKILLSVLVVSEIEKFDNVT